MEIIKELIEGKTVHFYDLYKLLKYHTYTPIEAFEIFKIIDKRLKLTRSVCDYESLYKCIRCLIPHISKITDEYTFTNTYMIEILFQSCKTDSEIDVIYDWLTNRNIKPYTIRFTNPLKSPHNQYHLSLRCMEDTLPEYEEYWFESIIYYLINTFDSCNELIKIAKKHNVNINKYLLKLIGIDDYKSIVTKIYDESDPKILLHDMLNYRYRVYNCILPADFTNYYDKYVIGKLNKDEITTCILTTIDEWADEGELYFIDEMIDEFIKFRYLSTIKLDYVYSRILKYKLVHKTEMGTLIDKLKSNNVISKKEIENGYQLYVDHVIDLMYKDK